MDTLTTERLTLRLPRPSDSVFLVRLMNDPDWLRFIGDRGVRTAADAEAYIEDKLLASFRLNGFGLWVVELRDDARAVGICGLLKRPTLEHVDVGFAFLPEGRGLGYGFEAAQRALDYAATELGLSRVVAITVPANVASSRLLQRLGLRYDHTMASDAGEELLVYAIEFSPPPGSRGNSTPVPVVA